MKTPLAIRIVILALLFFGNLPRIAATDPAPPAPVPKSALVEVQLVKAPGLNAAGSKWEVAYELRLTREASLWKERAKLDGKSNERVGDLLKQATVAKSLASRTGQKLLLEVPFTAETLEKLRNQPTSRIKLTSANMTQENLKRNDEQAQKFQVFLFYSVVRVYDAKLKKSLTIPVRFIWDFANFPDARFGVTIEINGEDSYNVNSSSPKNSKGGLTIVK